jgi:hypothetical protein
MSSPRPSDGDGVQALLRPLPEFDPDPGLWGRIHSLNMRRVRRRRVQRFGLVGVISVSLAVFWLFAMPPASRSGSAMQSVSVWQKHSQELQDSLRLSAQEELDPAIQARLRWIDKDLQSAYDRGASEMELGSLWAQRSALLQTLVRSGDARAVTRI